ncbi:MAG: efflux RND transporter permease subunit, partial [Bdellovibrionota bacterium]
MLWMAVTSDQISQRDLMTLVKERLKDQFTTVDGVGEVFLGGYVDPSLRVWVSSERLNRYALTVTDVINAIQLEHAEVPAGRIETATTEKNVRILGEAPNPKEFEKLAINRRGGAPNFTPISLGQVADIEDGLSDIRRISRSNFKPAVGMGIRKQRGSNAVSVGRGVKAKLAEIQKQLPEGVEMFVRFDATTFIEESVSELNFTLLLSALLTALVCWLFLGSLSATMNVVLAIPTSVVGSFIALYALGFTLNTFTLLGLSLAIGIVVDDAIIVLENIVRHYEMGKNRVEAALEGTREITFAAIAATAAVIAIFLPVAFMKGVIGKFFFQFGVTLSVAVALSLLEALTLTPMRCSQYLSISKRQSWIGNAVERFFDHSAIVYRRWLVVVLNHRIKVVAASILFFVLSIFSVKFINKEFVPSQDQGRLMIRVQTPVGSSLEFTDNHFKDVEKFLMARPETEAYFGAIGGFGGGEINTGMLFATFKPYSQRPVNIEKGKRLTQIELADVLRKGTAQFKDMKIFVQDMSLNAFSGKRGGFPL